MMVVDNTIRTAIHVFKVSNNWVVLKTGAKRALFKNKDKEQSINYAKKISKEDSLQLFIHNSSMDIKKVILPNEKPYKIRVNDVSVATNRRNLPKETKLIGGSI